MPDTLHYYWKRSSRDTMTDLFRRSEVLPEGRTNEEEQKLITLSGKAETAASRDT